MIACIADNMALIARLFYTKNSYTLNVSGCSLVSDVSQITLNRVKVMICKGPRRWRCSNWLAFYQEVNQRGYIAVAALDVITAFAVPGLSDCPFRYR